MKKLIFKGQEFVIMDETATHYICEPYRANEGYQYFSKSNSDITVVE